MSPMIRPLTRLSVVLAILGGLAHSETLLALEPAAEAGRVALSDDCFAELEGGKGREIACYFPMRLTAAEKSDLQRITRQYLQNLTCRLEVRILRTTVDEAISARDHVFQSPEQPVTCTVSTKSGTFDVRATFAPRVVFKNDIAVEGSPGLGNVTGISRILSWPVVQYVNRGPGMRSTMLQIVNAYRKHVREKKQHAATP